MKVTRTRELLYKSSGVTRANCCVKIDGSVAQC
nr:MAG TPA: hypothetical protein [Caudoviricetes sp.]